MSNEIGKNILIERSIVFSIDETELGSFNVKVYEPNKESKIPVLIEGLSEHDPIDFIEVIVPLVNTNLLKKMKVDIKTDTKVYVKCSDIQKNKYNCEYLEIDLSKEKLSLRKTDKLSF